MKTDPRNGVAAYCAAQSLLWLHSHGCISDATFEQIARLAQIIRINHDQVVSYTGAQAAEKILDFAQKWLEPPTQTACKDPFMRWIKDERLALAPTLEVTDNNLEELDWLTLPAMRYPLSRFEGTPPIFSMFNVLKSDFILARDLTWRAFDRHHWSVVEGFADTFDGAMYGPDVSAFILARRAVLDLLDKVAVVANHYFDLGEVAGKVSFGTLWRAAPDKITKKRPLRKKVENIIRSGVRALYGLIELSRDYTHNVGILNSHKKIRNAATHRFIILHDYLFDSYEHHNEIDRHLYEPFLQEALQALRISRSAIQLLVLAIAQNEQTRRETSDEILLEQQLPNYKRDF